MSQRENGNDDDDQYPLPYGGRPPFERESDTSEEAAESMQGSAGTLRSRVLAYIVEQGQFGATDDEIEVALDQRHQTASARRRELELMGFVQKNGIRRPTRSGRNANVYVRISSER